MNQLSIYKFKCPCCLANLDQENNVKFILKKKDHSQGVIRINPNFGNFESDIEGFNPQQGETYKFHCTSCESDLASNQFKNFAKVLMFIDVNVSFDVLFSTVYGEHETFVITEDLIEAKGNHPIEFLENRRIPQNLVENQGEWPTGTDWY